MKLNLVLMLSICGVAYFLYSQKVQEPVDKAKEERVTAFIEECEAGGKVVSVYGKGTLMCAKE